MKPTRAHLDALAARLHDQRARTIVERIIAHLDREKRSGRQGPDGYPTATMGALGSSATSSVEAAVIVLVDSPDHLADEHARRTWAAIRHLEAAVIEVDRCLANLDRLDALAVPEQTGDEDQKHCRNHLHVLGLQVARKTGDLCDFCWSYKQDTSKLPTRPVLEAVRTGKIPKVRA